jgi:hypothetical protein
VKAGTEGVAVKVRVSGDVRNTVWDRKLLVNRRTRTGKLKEKGKKRGSRINPNGAQE